MHRCIEFQMNTMKPTRLIVFGLLCAFFVGCSSKEEKLDGSIFVVTEGAENIRLGLITVSMFEEKQIEPVLTKTTAGLNKELADLKEKYQSLRKDHEKAIFDRDAAQKKYDQVENAYATANHLAEQTAVSIGFSKRPEFSKADEKGLSEAINRIVEYERLGEKIHSLNESLFATTNKSDQGAVADEILRQSAIMRLKRADTNSYDEALLNKQRLQTEKEEVLRGQALWDRVRPVYLKQFDEAERLRVEVENSRKKLEGITGLVQDLSSSIAGITERLENWAEHAQETYFSNMPMPIATAKTDADGKFSLSSPVKEQGDTKNGRFVLAAKAQRKVPSRTEKYFWIIRINSKVKANPRVIFSNDNLMSANSSEAAVYISNP